MRSTRILAALALVAAPSLLSAQVQNCSATTPAGAPKCSLTRDVSTVVPNLLFLGISGTAAINLNATDTVAYNKTYTANPAAVTGDVIASPNGLNDASANETVNVRANRGYDLQIQATGDLFSFSKDANGACRTSEVATPGGTGCSTTETLAGKPVGDLYWSTSAASGFAPVAKGSIPLDGTMVIHGSTSGERYSTPVYFKSAWYYSSDIPGTYTATIRYTVVGK